jgi:hypothetical protein
MQKKKKRGRKKFTAFLDPEFMPEKQAVNGKFIESRLRETASVV